MYCFSKIDAYCTFNYKIFRINFKITPKKIDCKVIFGNGIICENKSVKNDLKRLKFNFVTHLR